MERPVIVIHWSEHNINRQIGVCRYTYIDQISLWRSTWWHYHYWSSEGVHLLNVTTEGASKMIQCVQRSPCEVGSWPMLLSSCLVSILYELYNVCVCVCVCVHGPVVQSQIEVCFCNETSWNATIILLSLPIDVDWLSSRGTVILILGKRRHQMGHIHIINDATMWVVPLGMSPTSPMSLRLATKLTVTLLGVNVMITEDVLWVIMALKKKVGSYLHPSVITYSDEPYCLVYAC